MLNPIDFPLGRYEDEDTNTNCALSCWLFCAVSGRFFVREMDIHFSGSQSMANWVSNAGRDTAKPLQVQHLGFGILKFAFAACRLLNALLQRA